jgi:hypothetical protein
MASSETPARTTSWSGVKAPIRNRPQVTNTTAAALMNPAPGIQTREMQRGGQTEQNRRDGNGQDQAECDAVHQPAMAVIEPIGSVALRDKRVEAEQQPHREYTDAHEDRAADADSTDRLRSQWPHHERIDDPHRHPRKLREHDWHRQHEHRLELFAEVV